MTLVSDAGSMRALGSWAAMTWPLVESSKIQDLAAMVGGGRVCATAALISARLAAKAAKYFFMDSIRQVKAQAMSLATLPSKKEPNYSGRKGAQALIAPPHLCNQILDVTELAVEKVIGTWNHDDRDVLRAGPVNHVGQGNGVVRFAVDQDGVGRHVGHCPLARSGAHQHQALGRGAGSSQALGELGLHESAERKAGQGHGQAGILGDHVAVHRGHVIRFADAMVVHAFGSAHAAEIEAHRHVADADEGARQGMGHLVVHRAAVEGWGWATRAMPRGTLNRSASGWSITHSILPTLPAKENRSVCLLIKVN